MENRIKEYQIDGNSIVLPRATSIEDIRLIYNETQKVLICSTAKKDNLSAIDAFVVNHLIGTTTINVPTSICVLMPTDNLTIKCDYGDEGATESTLTSAKEEILTAVEKGGGGSELLEDFFGVVPDDSEEIITDEEITQELEDIFNTIFN